MKKIEDVFYNGLMFRSNIVSIFVLLTLCFFNTEAGVWHRAKAMTGKSGQKSIMVHVTDPAGQVIYLHYSVPSPEFEPVLNKKIYGETAEKCIIGNALEIRKEGVPVLPVISSRIIVPFGREIEDIQITDFKKVKISGKHFIEYGDAEFPLRPGVKVPKAVPEPSVYNSDKPFPEKSCELVTVQKKRGVTIAFINIYPVTFFSASGQVEYYENISIRIKTKPKENTGTSGIRVRLNSMTGGIGREVENPEAAKTYIDGSITGIERTGSCDPSQDYKYIIITNEKMMNATEDFTLDNLLNQRESRGISGKIMTVEEIYKNYFGIDKQEKIRNFILDAYNSWGIEYVLIGGDCDIVPIREFIFGSNLIPSDLYYQCLDGDFNSDGDDKWGESTDGPNGDDIDMLSEVLIGRASAEDEKEMSNIIYKIISYENDSVDIDYLLGSLMLGEELGGTLYGKDYLNDIHYGTENTSGFISDSVFNVSGLYDVDSVWTREEIIEKVNTENYSIFNHVGHANDLFNMKMCAGDEEKFTNNKFIFAYSIGCNSGYILDDCIAERFTTSNRNGMWGGVFNAYFGYPAMSTAFLREFWDAYFGEKLSFVGDMNADSHEDNIYKVKHTNIYYRLVFYETNLFTDPCVPMRGRTNNKLMFTSEPVKTAKEGIVYEYQVSAKNELAGSGLLTMNALELPQWLELTDFGKGAATVTGIPGRNDIGLNNVTLIITDECTVKPVRQQFRINVDSNAIPKFLSIPDTIARSNEKYWYEIIVYDSDPGAILSVNADSAPEWLSFIVDSTGRLFLDGVPGTADSGIDNRVVLSVSDGVSKGKIEQKFNIFVEHFNAISWSEITIPECKELFNVTPNPVEENESIRFIFNISDFVGADLCVFDYCGNRIFSTEIPKNYNNRYLTWDGKNSEEENISHGTYLAVLQVQYINGTKKVFKKVIGIKKR